MANYYVDKDASGANDGTSWTDAYESFADIDWTNDISAGDTIYISGGSTSKKYYETLTIGKSGTSGNIITINSGANSPSPSGHNGTVIIDGGYTRGAGVYASSRSYIKVTNLRLQNHVGTSGSVDLNNSSYLTISNLVINNATSRGMFLDNCNNCIIEYNDIHTGDVSNSTQTDGIYMQFGEDNQIRYNYILLGNNGNAHNDPLQIGNPEARVKIYGNYLAHDEGRGGADDQGTIITGPTEYVYFYNNIVIGSYRQPYQALFLRDHLNSGGIYHVYNNIIIAQEPVNGWALRVFGEVDANQIYIKNNICYSPGWYAMVLDNGASPASRVDYNQLYSEHPSYVAEAQGSKSWAQWQAAGYDVHGYHVNPSNEWDSGDEYRPLEGATSIGNGTDLSTYFTKDRDQTTRSAWDIGAYEFESEDEQGARIILLFKS